MVTVTDELQSSWYKIFHQSLNMLLHKAYLAKFTCSNMHLYRKLFMQFAVVKYRTGIK